MLINNDYDVVNW